MGDVRRWLKRIGATLLVLLIALTVAALIVDAVTAGGVPAKDLYAGPYVRVDGGALAYRRWGTRGTPIVLIGGFIEAADVWRLVAPRLRRAHRVYALDLPPFGYSERRGPYTLDGWLRKLEGFERALHIRRPTLVGHSLGAAVVVGEALRRPQNVNAIVLLDGDAIKAGGAPSWVPSLIIDPYYTAIYRLVTSWDWVFRRGLHAAYGPKAPKFSDEDLARWQRPFRVAGTAAAFKQMLRYGIQGYELADLRKLHGVRAIVAWGAHDTTDSVSAGRKTAAALRAPFMVLPRAGHLSMLANPAGVAGVIARAARP